MIAFPPIPDPHAIMFQAAASKEGGQKETQDRGDEERDEREPTQDRVMEQSTPRSVAVYHCETCAWAKEERNEAVALVSTSRHACGILASRDHESSDITE